MKKILSLSLAMILIIGLVAGCGEKKTTEEETKTTQQDNTDTKKDEKKESEALEGSLLSAEMTTFSIFLNFNNMPFNPEWRVWQEIANKTNVQLKGVISQSNANEEEAFSLMLSSGDLADIIGYKNPADLEQLGRDGGLIPLNDLIKEHAPDIQKLLDSDPKFKKFATSLDGNIYFIPKNMSLPTAEFWWVRKDWLDKLNLEIPTTVDELYQVLTAFRNQDPNGNGKKDEVPLFDRAGHKMPDEYLYLFDTSTEFYPRDGKMVFEPMEKGFVEGVKELAKWYEEGLIDPEIFTRGAKSRDILYSADLAGVTHDWPSTGNYNKSLADSIAGFENLAIAPPAMSDGKVIERTTRYPVAGWGISSACQDPVTLIKFFNYFFTPEGSDLINFGIEGETYTVEDGKKVYTDAVMKNADMNPLNYLRSLGVQYRIGMMQNPEYEFAFMSPSAKAAAKLYSSNPEWYPKELPPYFDGELNLKYSAEEEREYKKIMAEVRPYVDRMFQEWLLGTTQIDDNYEEFVEELKNRGIDRAIEINQKAYETFLAK